MDDTSGQDYTERLQANSGATWKRWLNVQAPYRWNLRRQDLGRTLDVGCGIGRNLAQLPAGSLGVDHNETSVAAARAAGLDAVTNTEWGLSGMAESAAFDSLLFAHVIEHMTYDDAVLLVLSYLGALQSGGKVFFICPQERGYASDPTHLSWTTGGDLEQLSRDVGLRPSPSRSFPGPRVVGRIFTYNEFNVMARKP